MTNIILCKTCKKPKAPYICGLCEEHICKNCAQFLGEDAFAFEAVVPAELKHQCYCYNCFDDKVSGPLNEYNEAIVKAENIIIYGKDQSRLTRYLKRKEDPYSVDNCIDSNEAVMRMSYWAAKANFNCLIDVEISSRKVDVGTYKKSVWSATAVPITIDPKEIRGH